MLRQQVIYLIWQIQILWHKKQQCQSDIGKYLKNAKDAYDEQCCIGLQEYCDMDAGDFC